MALNSTFLQTLFDLYKATGEHLVGRSIILRFRVPYAKNAAGAVTSIKGGVSLVEIKPGLGNEEEFKTFLHEIAHARLHYAEQFPQP